MAVMGPKGMLFGSTAIVDSAVVAKRFLKIGSDQNHVVQATAASVSVGIADDNQQNAGHGVAFAHSEMELVLCEAGAAFAQFAKLTPDASGRAVTATTGQPVAAIAMQAATAAGDLVCVKPVSTGTMLAP